MKREFKPANTIKTATSSLVLSRFSRKRVKTEFQSDEAGGMTVFSLFIFFLMLIIAGIGVDLMWFESERAKLQATTDAAVLAAANLDQSLSSEEIVRDYFEKSGLDPDIVSVVVSEESPNGIDITARSVTATTRLEVDTFFMQMIGVQQLASGVGSGAEEGYRNVEISLVVDISGSMSGQKLTDLKRAAKEFVNQVVEEDRTVGITSVSIIPYNHVVVAGNDILSRMDADGEVIAISDPRPYPGALTAYRTEHNYSTCLRFRDDDFFAQRTMSEDYPSLRALSPTEPVERIAHFAEGRRGYETPANWARQCDEGRSAILPHSTNIRALEDHIDGLRASGMTAIDTGMKWGVALLDPAFRPVINGMVDDRLLPEIVENRPGDYNDRATSKIIVLMTDGENTAQQDLYDEFKNGPTRVWYSDMAGSTKWRDRNLYPVDGRRKTEFDGYFVEMPGNAPHRRFWRPESPTSSRDGTWFGVADIPPDLRQLDRIELNHRLSIDDAGNALFRGVDEAERARQRGADNPYAGYGTADARLSSICAAARQESDIFIYTIAFHAPLRGQEAMLDCATEPGFYYDAGVTDISTVFASIAASISKLRLTQ